MAKEKKKDVVAKPAPKKEKPVVEAPRIIPKQSMKQMAKRLFFL